MLPESKNRKGIRILTVISSDGRRWSIAFKILRENYFWQTPNHQSIQSRDIFKPGKPQNPIHLFRKLLCMNFGKKNFLKRDSKSRKKKALYWINRRSNVWGCIQEQAWREHSLNGGREIVEEMLPLEGNHEKQSIDYLMFLRICGFGLSLR